MTPNLQLTTKGNEPFTNPEMYRRLVASYYLTMTRLNIAYSVVIACWEALGQILYYLKGARGRGLFYSNHGHSNIFLI